MIARKLTDPANEIERLIRKEKWTGARKLIERELKITPHSHWLLDRQSVTLYEEKKYQKALAIIEKAYAISPHCPLVLWDYAGTSDALGDSEKAVELYNKIIVFYTEEGFQEEGCSEGIAWSKSLVMDCFFRLGVCFQKLRKASMAAWFFEKYVYLRKAVPELTSLYHFSDAERQLALIEKQPSDREMDPVRSEAKLARSMLAGSGR
jgi:tetratricopeptide (TPR) repeat protein